MFIVPYLILFFALLSLTMILTGIRSRKNLKKKLEQSLGKIPERKDYEFPTDMKSIENYHFHKNKKEESLAVIDAITWNDLDMDKIFQRMNTCLSSVGEEYLYHILHCPSFEPDSLSKREDFISYLEHHPEDRLSLQLLFARLGKTDYNGLASFIFDHNHTTLKNPTLYNLLAVLPMLSIALMFVRFKLGLGLFLCSLVVNTLLHYLYKQKVAYQVTTISYLSSLLWCADKLNNLTSKGLEPFLKPLRKPYQVFRSITSKISVASTGKLSDLDVFVEYLRIIFLMDLRNYNKIFHKISAHPEEFHQLFQAMGEIEVAIAVLSFRKSLPFFTFPTFHQDNRLAFEELFHPLLKDPVSNTAILDNDCLITGSNASGKSTFIKAIAINSILAQTIYTCTARSFHTRSWLVISSMAVQDSITDGESYFITEIKSLKRILDRCRKLPCLCFVDEILRGTNTIERIAASASVLKHLHQEDGLCLVASHDIELTEMLSEDYTNYHFRETVTDEGILFDYKLKQGPSQTRNAIKLLHFMEFDPTIVTDADRYVEKFVTEKTWL